MKVIEDVLNHGVSASQETLLSWCRMFAELSNVHLESASFSEYQHDFQQQLNQFTSTYLDEIKSLTLNDVKKYLEEEVRKENIKSFKKGAEIEYRLADLKKTNLYKNKNEVFFLSNRFAYEPVCFFRSKLQNWLKVLNVSEHEVVEVCIAATEAIENAIKYSDKQPVVIRQWLEKNRYKLFIANFAEPFDYEDIFDIKRSREASSSICGVLIMSKIFDEFKINHDEQKNMVFVTGSKNIN